MGKLARKRHASRDRRAERYGRIGRAFEREVAGLLEKMRDEKLIAAFERHEPQSEEDHDGRDFTVTARVGAKEVAKSFGVTISLRNWGRAKTLHPHVPQFCFPLGTKPETIRARILELFKA